ncbi:zinc ribbon domain-containing protein [Nocardioides sp. KIGAM211]|uniref:Zinc ribbon domain-containing protein n=1 Tax=Nocardioides luti TaxID=2761101 RepID=A0A7X0RHR4_9ACTN|nr:zinc ribbon domain-containing protein [Nocardioides luti]MBB6627259.1 zinc ribbon domain-containing protein [Nocardioides luti]
MSTTPNPGFARQSGARTVFRVAAVVLALLGAYLLYRGFSTFANTDLDVEDTGAPDGMLTFLGGGLCLMGALVCANLGFMGAAARYGAGETMPVVKDSAAYLSDGEGVLGVGRTVDDAPARTGRFCSSCGVRNDDGARFCDACGSALA